MFEVDISKAVAILKQFNQLNEVERAKALSRALNRTIGKANTLENRGLRKTYNIKRADLAKKLTPKSASTTRLTAVLNADTKTLSIARFVQNMDDLQGRDRDSLVEVEIFKGKPTFAPKGSFLVPNKNFIAGRGKYQGGKFVFDKARKPINPIRTVSVAGAGINEAIQRTLPEPLEQTLNERITHEIAFILR